MRPRRSRRRDEADFTVKVRVTSAATNSGGTAGKPPTDAIWFQAASGTAPVRGNYP